MTSAIDGLGVGVGECGDVHRQVVGTKKRCELHGLRREQAGVARLSLGIVERSKQGRQRLKIVFHCLFKLGERHSKGLLDGLVGRARSGSGRGRNRRQPG